MNTLSFKTIHTRPQDVQRKWYVIDAEAMVVGRMCSKIASLLAGKHKVNYSTHVDVGDNVIVINADKVRFTGKKMNDKVYLTYSGYPGGQKSSTPKEMLEKHPTRVVEIAVRKMLPKNKLGDAMFGKLFVYKGPAHPHAAQKPEIYTI